MKVVKTFSTSNNVENSSSSSVVDSSCGDHSVSEVPNESEQSDMTHGIELSDVHHNYPNHHGMDNGMCCGGHEQEPTSREILRRNFEWLTRVTRFSKDCADGGPRIFTPFVDLCQNCIELAIQSLDSLNDQIVQFIFSPKACDFDVDADDDCMQPKQREALKASMALMRRLLMDAQAKFRKMVDDNKQLATRIDGDIQSAHEEVSILRAELEDTNRRISELAPTVVTGAGSGVSQVTVGVGSNNSVSGGLESDTVPLDTSKAPEWCQRCSRLFENQVQDEVTQLRDENDKLGQQNRSLQREVEELRSVKERMVAEDHELRPQVQKLEADLQHTKEALAALKADRKRLKAEKFDLLNQMKQLYGTLEDKEKELRDFIRNYEQRMKESDQSMQQMSDHFTSLPQLADEKDAAEMEKWKILKHAQEESEKSVTLCSQLTHKENLVKQLQEELAETRRQLSRLGYYSDHDSQSSKVNGFHTPGTITPMITTPNGRDSFAANPLVDIYNSSTPVSAFGPDGSSTPANFVDNSSIYSSTLGTGGTDSSSLLSIHPGGLSRSAEELTHMLSTLDLKKKSRTYRRNNAKGTWGSISKVFSRGRSRRSMDPSLVEFVDKRTSWSPHNSLCASPLTEETYSEKIRLLEEAQTLPMEAWKASMVLAWLEVSMGMHQYALACAENIKSGKVLLELNDGELEVGLGITNPMHRRKLRLAIEEFRETSVCKYPKISELSHVWVCSEWLPAMGLGQYVDTFALHLVDGRMLDYITKKDMEKFLGVTRKFHQASIMHGVQLLRMVEFDRQILSERRSMCEQTDGDPLVWTNQRFVQWAQSVDLAEYAMNLKDSGVHGALVVLEPSFTTDTMATALGIPQSKNIIRRHLTTELESIIHPARVLLEQEYFHNRQLTKKDKHLMGSLGRSFSHSYASNLPGSKGDGRRSSLRGSLTRALGLKMKQDLQNLASSSTPPAAAPPSSISHMYSSSAATSTSKRSSSRSAAANSNTTAASIPPLPPSQFPSSSSSSSAVLSSTAPLSNSSSIVTPTSVGGGASARSTPTPTGKSISTAETAHRRVKSSGDIEAIPVTPV